MISPLRQHRPPYSRHRASVAFTKKVAEVRNMPYATICLVPIRIRCSRDFWYFVFSDLSVPKILTVRIRVRTSVAIWLPSASCSCSVVAALRLYWPYLTLMRRITARDARVCTKNRGDMNHR